VNAVKQKFSARLYTSSNWVCVAVPFDVQKTFGVKGRVAIRGTMNGFEFRSSFFPNGDGTHFMLVNKTMQKSTELKAGDFAEIEIDQDTEPRTLEIPDDVSAALKTQPLTKNRFEKYFYSHQKEWLGWISEAKKPETRKRRIEKAIQTLMEKSRD
jgi:hypothetical protein